MQRRSGSLSTETYKWNPPPSALDGWNAVLPELSAGPFPLRSPYETAHLVCETNRIFLLQGRPLKQTIKWGQSSQERKWIAESTTGFFDYWPWAIATDIFIKVFPFYSYISSYILQSRHKSSVTWSEKRQRKYKITSGLRRKIFCVHLPDRYVGRKPRSLGDPWSNVFFYSKVVELFVHPRGPHITACENIYNPGKERAAPFMAACSWLCRVSVLVFSRMGQLQEKSELCPETSSGIFICLFFHGKFKPLLTSLWKLLQKS